MGGTDVFRSLEVGDGAGDADDAEVGPHREAHLGHQVLQGGPARLAERAVTLDLLDAHFGIGGDRLGREAVFLRDACLEHAGGHGLAGLGLLRPHDAVGRHAVKPELQVYTLNVF